MRPGYKITHPNRERAICKATRVVVVIVLLVSVALMLLVTFGGWNTLQGLTPVNFIWCAVYLVMAFFVARWARGLLPIAAGLALLLLAFAAIASLGFAGTSWYDRSHGGFGPPHAIGGGSGFSASLLGTLTVLLVPVELLLVIVALVGFSQGWNVEREVREDQDEADGAHRPGRLRPAST